MTTLRKNLRREENSIRNEQKEWMTLIDTKGKVHKKHTDRNTDSVYISPKTFNKINRITNNQTILTHNHPYETLGNLAVPSSFSPNDLYTAIVLNLAGVRAVDPVYTYIIKRPKKGWPKIGSAKKFTDELMKIDSNTRKYWKKMVNEGKMDLYTYERDIAHYVAREFAKHLGLPYVRNKRKGMGYKRMPITEIPDWYKPQTHKGKTTKSKR